MFPPPPSAAAAASVVVIMLMEVNKTYFIYEVFYVRYIRDLCLLNLIFMKYTTNIVHSEDISKIVFLFH